MATMKKYSEHKKLLKQAIKEFWLQLLLATAWTVYKSYNNSNPQYAANFAGAFFFTSWIFGQIFRIKKQQKVEGEFDNVKKELEKLLNKITEQTDYLIGHTTGGDSIGYFIPSVYVGTMHLSLGFINSSKFPVFDIFAEWIDLDEPINIAERKLWTRHKINLGTIHPSKMASDIINFDMSNRARLRINIFLHTRNRNITQQIRVEKISENLKIATHTTSENFKEVRVPDDFPGYDANDPEKVFK